MNGGQTPDERHEDVLRRALEAQAASVQPTGDGLERIRSRTGRRAGWLRPLGLALGVAVVAGVAGFGIGALLSGDDDRDADGGPVASPSPTDSGPSPSPTDSAGPSRTVTVPVYYVAETPGGFRLFREFRRVTTTESDAVAAVTQMFADPLDPDYGTLWDPATRVLGVEQTDETIEVDLSTDALRNAGVGAQTAELSVQQLVYTVTATVQSNKPVQILIDGAQVDDLWGHVAIGNPIDRADPIEVRSLVQINDPNEGDAVSRTFQVTGEAAVFEATFLWRLEQGGQVVADGTAMTSQGQQFSPFSFTITAPAAGEYVVVIEEEDLSDGEGRPPMTDTRAVTVQ